ncbi:hypothetical protein WJX81_008219 [Elliptochloris bilobata]|uniref:NAD(P)-binding domain-containing protein n=1 Tax=Elliptochloris bilobata TaxID=381761 RepID=A0AAW1RR72_9CHLO
MLDFITAGPKLRKWYGEGERGAAVAQPTGRGGADGGEAPDAQRTAVLVTDVDSATGEQVVLQLILARQEVRLLTRDPAAARSSFGEYVTPVDGHVGDPRSMAAALRGVRTIICTGRLGALLPAAAAAGVEHIVLLTAAGDGGGGPLGSLLGGEEAVLRDAGRERAVAQSGVPHTLVRTGALRSVPAGSEGPRLLQGPLPADLAAGAVSREDAAAVLAGALAPPSGGRREICVLASGDSPAAVPVREQLDNVLAEEQPPPS